jgi:GntR family transcriptional repressor for pyruvate dehydrogenase complex
MIDRVEAGPKMPEVITRHLLQSIFKKKIKVGEKLPSEKDLCEMIGVSRGSLRESLAIMEFMGIIENKRKKRIVVRDQLRAERVLSLIKISDKPELIYDFIEIRKALEIFNVELATMRATPQDLREIGDAIEELRGYKDKISIKANQRFHIGIAKATHNALLALIEELLMHVLDSFRQRVRFSPERKEQVIGEHEKIFKAVCEKDAQRAKALMLEHLGKVQESIEVSGLVMPNVSKKAE